MTGTQVPRVSRRISRSKGITEPRGIVANTTTISVNRADHSTSRQIDYQDEFEGLSGIAGLWIAPPMIVERLFHFIEHSNILQQCIAAHVVNTTGTGWEVVQAAKKIDIDEDERDELQSFIDFANSEESLCTVMSKAEAHRQAVGFGFIEVMRDIKGDVALMRHASSLHTRIGHKHEDEVLVKYDIKRGKRLVTVKEFRTFRRYLQVIAGRVTFFKEFGDPRRMNSATGAFEGEAMYTPDSPATEILHIRNQSNDSYGLPLWIGQLPNIIGSREAEEVNMRYFEDNTIPPAMLTVSGGRLTAESHRNLTNLLAGQGMGRDRQHKMVLIEALGDSDSLDGKGTPVSLNVEKLADTRASDGLFTKYDEGNRAKIRSSWRLPAVATGEANEHNFATANVAMFAAESQVFAPARNENDEFLNNRIVYSRLGLRLKTVKLASRTPAITSPEGQIKAMTALNVMGAITPRSAQKLANTMLQIELDVYPEKGKDGWEDWMDRPMAISMRPQPGAAKDVGEGEHTQAEQSVKDDATKALEAEGNINTQPKNGEQ